VSSPVPQDKGNVKRGLSSRGGGRIRKRERERERKKDKRKNIIG
jgi:hypothetical protein